MKAIIRHVDIETGGTAQKGLGMTNQHGESQAMEMTTAAPDERIVAIETLTDTGGFGYIRVWLVRDV